MKKIDVLNIKGEKVRDISLNEKVWGIEPNDAVLYDAIVLAQNNQRQGTASTKTRSEVSGGGRKPWRQKGTGRARQGSTKGPQWAGGGIVFAPKPRDFSQKVNKTMKEGAFKSAISAKLAEGNLIVLDEIVLKEAKTKEFANILEKFKVEKNVEFVLADVDQTILRAANNIPNVKVTYSAVLNTYDIVANSKLYITKEAIKKIEEAYV